MLRRLLLSAIVLVAGCLRPFEPMAGPGDASPPPATGADGGGPLIVDQPTQDLGAGGGLASGRDVFAATVKPALDQRCAGCHAAVGGVGPSFMKPDAYDSILAWPGMITRDPAQSLLLTKGPHNNVPYFSDPEKAQVFAWLAVEARALAPSMRTSVATPPVPVSEGPNTVLLDGLGKDFLGARVTFDATRNGQALKVTKLTLWASGPAGLRAVHPLFLGVRNGVRRPDPVDSLDGVDLLLPQGASAPMGPGLLFLTNILQNDQLSIAFQTIAKWSPGGPMGGCKDVDAFTQRARPAIQRSRCDAMCHAGADATARNSLDMSMLADPGAAAQQVACAQVLLRVDPQAPASSVLFLVTDPATMSNHKLRFTFPDRMTFDAFVNDVSTWIAKEK